MADTMSLTLVCQGLGTLRLSHSERGHEFGEVRKRVVGPRRGLGMVLHSEKRELAMANPLDGPVVEIEVRHLERGRSGNAVCIANHSETMVLGGDEHLVGADIAYRVVPSPMTVGQLSSGAAIGESHELVPEADTERGEAGPGEPANGVERVADRGRIAGAIGKKETVWL